MKIKNIYAVSLVEVIVASIIFLIASAGAFAAFSMAQKGSTVSEKEVIAANYGRQLLEDLRAKVDQRNWTGSWYLTCDSAWHTWPTAPQGWDTFTGTASYNCSDDGSGARKVTLNVVW